MNATWTVNLNKPEETDRLLETRGALGLGFEPSLLLLKAAQLEKLLNLCGSNLLIYKM